jgi:hypothetical protein
MAVCHSLIGIMIDSGIKYIETRSRYSIFKELFYTRPSLILSIIQLPGAACIVLDSKQNSCRTAETIQNSANNLKESSS